MNSYTFLILNLVLAFYNIGIIWTMELDVFRSWRTLDENSFYSARGTHWKWLPYFVFIPVGLALIGSIGLLWFHPNNSPLWMIWSSFSCQVLAHILTFLFWGRWQAQIYFKKLKPTDPVIEKLIKTHWIRTALMTIFGFILLSWILKIS